MGHQVPPHSGDLKVAFPEERVLLLTLNRPSALNAMSPRLQADLGRVLDWFDNEPSLW
jgi:enoyl-CoA hydratase/carnithine racemase